MNTIILNAIGPIVHVIAGLITPIWYFVFTGTAVDYRVLVFCIFLSLLPDIDTQTSTLGRAFPFIAEPIERRFGHRQITHSLLALLVVGAVLWAAFPTDWLLLLSAYGSHLIIDTLTGTQGIPLLWPAQLRFYLLRIRPKSTGEVLLGFCCVLLLIAPYFSITHQMIAGLTPPEETLTLQPTPLPTATPATFIIKISHVYDIDTEILVAPGDTITTGQKIANLQTYRLLKATPTKTPTPTMTPTVTPSPLHLVIPSPFPTPDPLYLAELDNQRSLAHARYQRAIATGTPDPNKQAAAPSYNLAIDEKRDCMRHNDPDSWRYWQCKTEMEALELTAVSLLATSPSIDPLDSNIAYYQWQAAEIRYQQALAHLTPPPSPPPTNTPTTTPTTTNTPTATPETPTPTLLPAADEYAVYAQISGEVAAVNLVSVDGNSVTVQIIVLIDPTNPLFTNPFAAPTHSPLATRHSSLIPAEVVRVIDGDTAVFRINNTEETVRFLGVNAPETVKPDAPVECYGPEASEFTKSVLVEGTAVFLELDQLVGERDRYGRLLAHIWLEDGSLFNDVLLQQGFVEFANYGNPTSYDGRYQGAVAVAAASQSGLWGACP